MSLPDALAGRTQTFVETQLPKPPPLIAPAAGAPLVGRDQRLDMFRGLALLMIFINHVPGTIYENWTNRNFGFSDSAEAFVFMSGMAAGLAYSKSFRSGPLWPATARVWARARQLYFVHIACTAIVLGIFAAGALWLGAGEILTQNLVHILFQQPLGVLIGLPTLTFQLGYLNILPLYTVMLLVSPALLMLGLRWPRLVFLGSILLWIAAGQFRLNFPNFPLSGGWFFNPFAWQILFVTGLLAGMAMKQGQRFMPYSPVLFGLAAALVIFILLWTRIPALASLGGSGLAALRKLGAPFYLVQFDKTFVSLPRLLHALALFYVLASLPAIKTLAENAALEPLRLLGRHGLPVFATGTVLAMALQTVKSEYILGPALDGTLLALGILLQLGLAWTLSRTNQMQRAAMA